MKTHTTARIGSFHGSAVTHLMVLLFVMAAATPIGALSTTQEYSVPTFSMAELRRLSNGGIRNEEDRGEDFRNALSTNGLLAVRLDDYDGQTDGDEWHSHHYSRDRRTALDGLCSCVDHPGFLQMDQTHELTLMGSSTARTSVATATVGLDHPLPLPKGMEETCGNEVLHAMDGLRDVVASVSQTFVAALDHTLLVAPDEKGHSRSSSGGAPTTLLRDEFGTSYNSISHIVKSANHLEHFHVYTNQESVAEKPSSSKTFPGSDVAWDWHTDAGLFLVFVPAWDCNSDDENGVDDSFYYRDTDGTTVRAKFDGGRTAIVMLGQGAQDWLDLPPPQKMRATTHSVRWSDSPREFPKQQRRAWYGMMNLVPESALVYGGKTLREVKQSLSLSHQHETDFQPPEYPYSSGMTLGCGAAPASLVVEEQYGIGEYLDPSEGATIQRRRRHLEMQDASMCNNVTNFFCWMTCMDIPKLDQAVLFLDAGYSLYCADESIMASGSSDKTLISANAACKTRHNMQCKGRWEKTVEGVPAAEINVTTLEMSGEIEEPFCYSGTTMYMEGFQWIQSSTCVILLFPSWVLDSVGKYAAAVVGTILLAIGLEKFIQQRRKTMSRMEEGWSRLAASAAFYAVQLTVGYMLMLIIMVYSGLLFLSVISGLVIGHILFNARDAIWPIYESPHLDTEADSEESKADSQGIETKQANTGSCCSENTPDEPNNRRRSSAVAANLLDDPSRRRASERAIEEGATHCMEFDRDTFEYYGSMEDGSNHESVEVAPSKKKDNTKRKTLDSGVPEGSTPCCQHGN